MTSFSQSTVIISAVPLHAGDCKIAVLISNQRGDQGSTFLYVTQIPDQASGELLTNCAK